MLSPDLTSSSFELDLHYYHYNLYRLITEDNQFPGLNGERLGLISAVGHFPDYFFSRKRAPHQGQSKVRCGLIMVAGSFWEFTTQFPTSVSTQK